MVIKDCDKIANILTTSLLTWDDDLSTLISDIVTKKKFNQAAREWWEWTLPADVVKRLKQSEDAQDIQLASIIQAKLLSWELWESAHYAAAKAELVRQIKNTWWDMMNMYHTLELLNNANASDLEGIARALWYPTDDINKSIKLIKDQMSSYIASDKSIYDMSKIEWGIKNIKAQVKKKRKEVKWIEYKQDTLFETKTTKEEAKAVTEEIQKLRAEEVKAVEKWENPTRLMQIDSEWKAIKEQYTKDWVLDIKWAMQAWDNYIVWRAVLSESRVDNTLFEAIAKSFNVTNSWAPLTRDEIEKLFEAWDLDVLLSKAFTNTKDLADNLLLREFFNDKLRILVSNNTLDTISNDKFRTIARISEFLDVWATFSNVAKYQQTESIAKSLWISMWDKSWADLYVGIHRWFWKLKVDKEGNYIIPDVITIAWIEIKPNELLEIVTWVTNDIRITNLINSKNWDDSTILWIATEYFLWKKMDGNKKLLSLFNRVKQTSKVTDVLWTTIKTITGKDVDTSKWIWYFDYRSKLYSWLTEKDRLKADYMQKRAEWNTMRIKWEDKIKHIDWTTTDIIKSQLDWIGKWWVLLVNDASWWSYEPLRDALNKWNRWLKPEEQIRILFPRWAASGNFTMDWWDILFKTVSSDLYDDIAQKVSIRTLWQASTTREMSAEFIEATTGKNADKLRYQVSYSGWAVDNAGNKLSDQQVEHFRSSKVRDENWNLMVVYHWTVRNFDEFDMSKLKSFAEWPGIYFSEWKKFAEWYWVSKEVYLNITNPLEYNIKDYRNFWKVLPVDTILTLSRNLYNRWLMSWHTLSYIEKASKSSDLENVFWLFEMTWVDVYGTGKMEDYLKVFTETTWYDWIHVTNKDVRWFWPNYWIAFNPDQIKYTNNKLPTTSRDMRYQISQPKWPTVVDSFKHNWQDIQVYSDWSIYSDWIRLWWNAPDAGYSKELWLKISKVFDEINKPSIISWKTVRELCEEYNIPLFLAQDEFLNNTWHASVIWRTWFTKWEINWKRFVQSMLTMRDEAIEWTIEHELFHAVFTTLDSKFQEWFVSKAKQLYNLDTVWANEMLADLFSEYMRIGTINLPKNKAIKEAKWFKEWVINKFQQLKNWLDDVDTYQEEVWKLFDDILSWKAKVHSWLSSDEIIQWNKNNLNERRNSLVSRWRPSRSVVNDSDEYVLTAELAAYQISNMMKQKWVSYEEALNTVANRPLNAEYKNDLLKWTINWQHIRDEINKMSGWYVLTPSVAAFQVKNLMESTWVSYEKALDTVANRPVNVEYKWWLLKWVVYWEPIAPIINNHTLDEISWIVESERNRLSFQSTWWRQFWTAWAEEWDIAITDALKVKMFWKERTMQDIADAYWIPIEVVDKLVTEEWLEAYWAFWNWMILTLENIKESTLPHEIFHWIFSTVDNKERASILDEATKLFWINTVEAEEQLADAFSEYARTGKFNYWPKQLVGKNWKPLKATQTFYEKVKSAFDEIIKFITWMGNHQAKVQQMFDDMINMKYLPDAWKPIDKVKALDKYNDSVEKSALDYYWALLWIDKNDSLYEQKISNLFQDKVWVSLTDLRNINNKSKFWDIIDASFVIDTVTAWRFENEVLDIWQIANRCLSLNKAELSSIIKEELWDLVDEDNILNNSNFEHIRETYIDFKTAWSWVEYLQSKGKLISLINWWEANEMQLTDIIDMFSNWSQSSVYKDMFYPNQTLTKEQEKKIINSLNSDLFDIISIELSNKLIKSWYSLPLTSIRETVFDYLIGKDTLSNDFFKAFKYKNKWITTPTQFKELIDSCMPKSINFNYEWQLYKWIQKWDISWLKNVFVEVDNPFIQDSYTTLNAIATVKSWKTTAGTERELLSSIIDKYADACIEWAKNWISFADAQKLKLQAWYALDMFEQDFLLPRYSKFLTTQERQGLIWMKYMLPLPIGWMKESEVVEQMAQLKKWILENYSSILNNKVRANELNMDVLNKIKNPNKRILAEVEAREKQLLDNWQAITKVWDDYVVIDIRKEISNDLKTLSSDIQWFDTIKRLWQQWLDNLSNEEAYWLLKIIEFAKNRSTVANMSMEVIYKMTPVLKNFDFFKSFTPVDWIPRALRQNLLLWNWEFNKMVNTSIFDDSVKRWIFSDIKNVFSKNWYLEKDELRSIVEKNVKENFNSLDKEAAKKESALTKSAIQTYMKWFAPYTYLKDLPKKSKEQIAIALQQQKEWLDKAMSYIRPEYKQFLNNVTVLAKDWEVKSLSDLMNAWLDDWQWRLFDDKSIVVKWADEIWLPTPRDLSESWLDKAKLLQDEYRQTLNNQYNDATQAILNEMQIVSEQEKNLHHAFMNNARENMRKHTLTSLILDAADSTMWINEEVGNSLRTYIFGNWSRVLFNRWDKEAMLRWQKIREAYVNYYSLDYDSLSRMSIPKWWESEAKAIALQMAKYFKMIERQLWSIDWVKWCTTNAATNIAFYHLWESVLWVNSVKWMHWIISWIEQNQFFKFFKFVPENWQYKEAAGNFIRKNIEDWWAFSQYKDYVDKITGFSRDEFNELFWSNFTDYQYKVILQWLSWFTETGRYWRLFQYAMDWLNWSSTVLRTLMSYPFQLLTIPSQSIAYLFKQKWFEKQLWMESMWAIDSVRSQYNVLDWAYAEINLFNKNAVNIDSTNLSDYYNRYWLPDVDDAYKNIDIYTTDDITSIYGKIDDYLASRKEWWASFWTRQLDPYKDNANNIIDWIFARNFKNIAFAKALKENNYIQFATAEEFTKFMADSSISREMKNKLMDAINVSAGRNFRNILWLWFWWIDRAIGWWAFSNGLYWLMNFWNFRGSWWKNIVRDTMQNIVTGIRLAKTWFAWEAWKDLIADYLAKTPEFMNLTSALYRDLVMSYRLARFQDNGSFEIDEEYWLLDFVSYVTDTLWMTSQWWQWIQSYWLARPVVEWVESAFDSYREPDVYKDPLWMWAFLNAVQSNAWRNWKPVNWLAKAINVSMTQWLEAWLDYVWNEWWKLSAGSLRYMMNEDFWNYWFSYETSFDAHWIPGIILWESWAEDKQFSYAVNNTETWEQIKNMFSWDNKLSYLWEIAEWFAISSQFFNIFRTAGKTIKGQSTSPYNMNSFSELVLKTRAWQEFYDKWFVTPADYHERKIFIDTILKNAKYRPGTTQFNNSIINYDDEGHMAWAKWNKADEKMELLLDHMKYETNEDWTFKLDSNGNRYVRDEWKAHMDNIRTFFYNQTYVADANYEFVHNFVENHADDTLYKFYVQALWQWQAYSYLEKAANQFIWEWNLKNTKADKKWTLAELQKSWQYYEDFLKSLDNIQIQWINGSIMDALQTLDQDSSLESAISIIKYELNNEWDKKQMDKFFEFDDDWNASWLNYQYKQQLMQAGKAAKALESWDINQFIAEISLLSNKYIKEDPSWVAALQVLDSIKNYVHNKNDMSIDQKIKTNTVLFDKYKEILLKYSDKAKEIMWDDYDEYMKYVGNRITDWSIDTIDDIAAAEMWNDEWASKSWRALSTKIKDLIPKLDLTGTKYQWNQWGKWGFTSTVPNFKIKGSELLKAVWVKWATLKNKVTAKWFKPTEDLSLKKDISRTTKKLETQEVKKKKQVL